MKKATIALIAMIVLASPFILAGVAINEFEANPPGTNAGHQWIELYSEGAPQDLTGWYIIDRDGHQFNLSGLITDFLVIDSLTGLRTSNENLSLYNNLGTLIDFTGFLDDATDKSNTWQRVPDGTGSFVFEDKTKGFSNLPTAISNERTDKICLIESESMSLLATISGFCITKVVFEVDSLGELNTTKIADNYSVIIPAHAFDPGSVNWKVNTEDCFNRTMEGNWQNFFVNEGTSLSINPSLPDGENEWYVSEPEFFLDSDDSDSIWYQWDSDVVIPYSPAGTGSFGLDNIPNAVHGDGTIWSAGFLELNYFSDVCANDLGRNETPQQKLLKVDLTNPSIEDLVPGEDAIVHVSSVEIYAYLDEVYNGNSGINLSSIIMKIDNVEVTPNIQAIGIDAKINYTADLTLGEHTVNIYVEDNTGRSSVEEWSFNVDIAPEFSVKIFSPEESIYETKRVFLNVSTLDEDEDPIVVDKLEYINNNDRRPRWATLCNNCDGYVRDRNLNEGENDIVIRAIISDVSKEENVSVFVDSKKPIIHSMLPKKEGVSNGSDFYIKYTETDVQSVMLYTEGDLGIESHELNCESGKSQECTASIDLEDHDGSTINYWFEVSDTINTAISKRFNITIDTTPPTLTINMPQNGTYDKKVPFNVSVSEEVYIEYMDTWEENPKWKKLCGSCEGYGQDNAKTKNFKKGIHNVIIKATDEAGNADEGEVGFLVDY